MKKLKRQTTLLILFTFSIISFFTFSGNQTGIKDSNPKYSLVKIFSKNADDMKRILREGLYFDHAEQHDGEYLETWISENDIDKLNRSGVSYEVVINDFEKYYNEQPKMTSLEIDEAIRKSAEEYNVTHSIYGTMGGYLKYDEVINKLDSMRIQYPNLISDKFSIGNSLESRQMWTVRVSNSPNAPTGRPEVWIHALIHAREPMSMEQSIYFMYWLLENYNIDPIATYILSNRELYFTPVFNPDGYEYNRSTNPNGGGMWRKNRSVNTGGSFGVDLNRNFGTYAFWNSTNNGSSTLGSDETYRGESPFSEPESRNAMNFVNSRNFKGILSYHTYGNYLIRPWGYVDAPTPDENIFQGISQDMVINNHFSMGRSNQTVAYGVRGVTDDWYYNDSAHSKIFSMTPEVGTSSDGFWPLQSRILPLAKLTLSQNIYFVLACGDYVALEKSVLNSEQYNQNDQGSLKVNFKNKGLMNASNVKIELVSQNPALTIQTNAFTYSNIASFNKDSVTFNFTVGASAITNSALKATLYIKQDNVNTVFMKDINVPVGSGNILLLDSAENGLTKWTTTSGGWNTTTTQSYSPNNSFTDSPTGNYSNSINRTLTLKTPINISATPNLFLSFWYRHDIDTMDNAYIDISADSGVTWQSAKFYNMVNNTWTHEFLDITSLANGARNFKLRFSMVSNGTIRADGIYIDNIKLVGYTNTPAGISNVNEIPFDFSLSQNYPNPFNPSTTISYSIPSDGKNQLSDVKLIVYNSLGMEVAELVNERKSSGNYSVIFNAGNLSSGVYFYRLTIQPDKLTSGEMSEVRKMILMK